MINDDQKIKEILKFIGVNYKEFLRQTTIQIKFRFEPEDLLHSVIDSFCKNLNHKTKYKFYIDKYYKLLLTEKLFNYIMKSVNININQSSSPFQKQLKNKKYHIFELNENINIIESVLSDEEEDKIDENNIKCKKIYSYFENENAKRLFGNYWNYYTELFLEYVQTKHSYSYFAKKFNCSEFTIYNHIRYVKNIIKKELKKDGLYD